MQKQPEDVHPRSQASSAPATDGETSFERFTHKFGRFFSSLNSLILALAGYLFISLITYVSLLAQFWPSYSKAGFITYEIATGGDPFNFQAELAGHHLLWHWLLSVHVGAWLIVPILIGTAVDAAFRQYEERQAEREKRLRKIIRKEARERLKLSGDTLEEFVENTIERFRNPTTVRRQAQR